MRAALARQAEPLIRAPPIAPPNWTASVRRASKPRMEAFLVSFSTVAIAEIRPHPLYLAAGGTVSQALADPGRGIVGTIANHGDCGVPGRLAWKYLTPPILDAVVGVSLLRMALWTLKPDKLDGGVATGGRGAFVATLIAFFIAEIGDKTQIATMALAAAYANLPGRRLRTTCA